MEMAEGYGRLMNKIIERFVSERYYWLCLLDRFMIMIKWKDHKIWYFYGDNYVAIPQQCPEP